jgi:phosphatidylglycerophosphate synthase
MLDTHGRKLLQPFIEGTARFCIKKGLNADHITWIAFLSGVTSSFAILLGLPLPGLALLWISGYLDAVDGTVARIQGSSSPWGTLLDITFDRLVEICIIIVLGIRFPSSGMALILLLSSIIFSMTVFLTVGALSRNSTEKSFYYQSGLAERTEGFLFLTLMVILKNHLTLIAAIFALTILLTGLQRMKEAYRLFSKG